MNKETSIAQQQALASADQLFPAKSMGGLRDEFSELRDVMSDVEKLVEGSAKNRIDAVREELDDYCPPVLFIGQMKAGKTSLINSLALQPGLLPSDVNPWTSVVTSLHINKKHPKGAASEFSFYDRDDWNELMGDGGRLGQIASRIGAEDEIDELRRQIEEVRAKAQKRLGKNFEMLLGQKHRFDYFDKALVERYVCLGDPDDPSIKNSKQGRFADLTRSADLYLDLPQYPIPVQIKDTPGVNDPFLMREQVTLHSLREASLCVVVLSATQALNTVDLALIQLLSSTDKGQVVIYVNRIDELDEPIKQVNEIRQSLERTLVKHGVAENSSICFGAAIWAEAALMGTLKSLPEDSRRALDECAKVAGLDDSMPLAVKAWQMSGVVQLHEMLGRILSKTSGRRLIKSAKAELKNIVQLSMARADKTRKVSQANVARTAETVGRLQPLMADLNVRILKGLDRGSAEMIERTKADMLSQADTFTGHAVDAMLSDRKSLKSGACDPIELRQGLKDSYEAYTREMRRLALEQFQEACDGLADIYKTVAGSATSDFVIFPPQMPRVSPPTALGRTIVVDVETTWMSRWRSKYSGQSDLRDQLTEIIGGEVRSIVNEIHDDQMTEMRTAVRQALATFLRNQQRSMIELAEAQVRSAKEYAALELNEKIRRQRQGAEIAERLQKSASILSADERRSEQKNDGAVSHAK